MSAALDYMVMGLAFAGIIVGVTHHNISAACWAMTTVIGLIRLRQADKGGTA